MIRYLTLSELLVLYQHVIEQSGGLNGVRSIENLESAVAQPRMTFEGQDIYPSLAEKAAALGYSIIMNHPFMDGNKRAGHAAMETFLFLNGYEINASDDEQEKLILDVAAGLMNRAIFAAWLDAHLQKSRQH